MRSQVVEIEKKPFIHRNGSCHHCSELTDYVINAKDKNIKLKVVLFCCRVSLCHTRVLKSSSLLNEIEEYKLKLADSW